MTMNQNKYLFYEDFDLELMPYVDPPMIIQLSLINKYYHRYYRSMRRLYRQAKQNFYLACELGSVWLAQWIYQTYPRSYCLEYCFKCACQNNHNDMVKWLWKLSKQISYDLDIHGAEECAFRFACANGNLSLCEYLIRLGEKSGQIIDIHSRNEDPFVTACKNGHLSVAQWLLSLDVDKYGTINIHSQHEEAVWSAYRKDHWDIVRWIIGLAEFHGPINFKSIRKRGSLVGISDI